MASVPCVECEDVASAVRCVQCEDNFCSLCFQYLHRKGKRATHTPIKAENNEQLDMPKQEKVEGTTAHFVEKFEAEKKKKKSEKKSQNNKEPENTEISRKLLEQINFTPLRLNEEERNLLGLMEGVLNISEYTDKVDVSSSNYGYGFGFFSFGSYGTNIRNKDQIIMRELDEIFSLISGLYTSTNLRRGKTLVLNRTFKDNSAFFQQAFEIARRFKIMNPDKMRTTYGKMMHLLQDAVTPGLLDFQVKVSPPFFLQYLQEGIPSSLSYNLFISFLFLSWMIPSPSFLFISHPHILPLSLYLLSTVPLLHSSTSPCLLDSSLSPLIHSFSSFISILAQPMTDLSFLYYRNQSKQSELY